MPNNNPTGINQFTKGGYGNNRRSSSVKFKDKIVPSVGNKPAVKLKGGIKKIRDIVVPSVGNKPAVRISASSKSPLKRNKKGQVKDAYGNYSKLRNNA